MFHWKVSEVFFFCWIAALYVLAGFWGRWKVDNVCQKYFCHTITDRGPTGRDGGPAPRPFHILQTEVPSEKDLHPAPFIKLQTGVPSEKEGGPAPRPFHTITDRGTITKGGGSFTPPLPYNYRQGYNQKRRGVLHPAPSIQLQAGGTIGRDGGPGTAPLLVWRTLNWLLFIFISFLK